MIVSSTVQLANENDAPILAPKKTNAKQRFFEAVDKILARRGGCVREPCPICEIENALIVFSIGPEFIAAYHPTCSCGRRAVLDALGLTIGDFSEMWAGRKIYRTIEASLRART